MTEQCDRLPVCRIHVSLSQALLGDGNTTRRQDQQVFKEVIKSHVNKQVLNVPHSFTTAVRYIYFFLFFSLRRMLQRIEILTIATVLSNRVSACMASFLHSVFTSFSSTTRTCRRHTYQYMYISVSCIQACTHAPLNPLYPKTRKSKIFSYIHYSWLNLKRKR